MDIILYFFLAGFGSVFGGLVALMVVGMICALIGGGHERSA